MSPFGTTESTTEPQAVKELYANLIVERCETLFSAYMAELNIVSDVQAASLAYAFEGGYEKIVATEAALLEKYLGTSIRHDSDGIMELDTPKELGFRIWNVAGHLVALPPKYKVVFDDDEASGDGDYPSPFLAEETDISSGSDPVFLDDDVESTCLSDYLMDYADERTPEVPDDVLSRSNSLNTPLKKRSKKRPSDSAKVIQEKPHRRHSSGSHQAYSNNDFSSTVASRFSESYKVYVRQTAYNQVIPNPLAKHVQCFSTRGQSDNTSPLSTVSKETQAKSASEASAQRETKGQTKEAPLAAATRTSSAPLKAPTASSVAAPVSSRNDNQQLQPLTWITYDKLVLYRNIPMWPADVVEELKKYGCPAPDELRERLDPSHPEYLAPREGSQAQQQSPRNPKDQLRQMQQQILQRQQHQDQSRNMQARECCNTVEENLQLNYEEWKNKFHTMNRSDIHECKIDLVALAKSQQAATTAQLEKYGEEYKHSEAIAEEVQLAAEKSLCLAIEAAKLKEAAEKAQVDAVQAVLRAEVTLDRFLYIHDITYNPVAFLNTNDATEDSHPLTTDFKMGLALQAKYDDVCAEENEVSITLKKQEINLKLLNRHLQDKANGYCSTAPCDFMQFHRALPELFEKLSSMKRKQENERMDLIFRSGTISSFKSSLTQQFNKLLEELKKNTSDSEHLRTAQFLEEQQVRNAESLRKKFELEEEERLESMDYDYEEFYRYEFDWLIMSMKKEIWKERHFPYFNKLREEQGLPPRKLLPMYL